MPSCDYGGNSDMYGLGIRVGFYTQWLGTIIANWLAKKEVPGLRLANSLFIGATFIALIIQTLMKTVRPLDIYIILLLTYGSYYAYVPTYLWRLFTGCSPLWDPTRWTRVRPTALYFTLNLLLLIAVSCYQIWFWTTGIRSLAMEMGCQEYSFLFTKVRLDSGVCIALNLTFALGLLVCCSFSLCLELKIMRPPKWLRIKDIKYRQQIQNDETICSSGRILFLQVLQSLSNLAVAITIIAATELTIHWNNLTDVHDLSTTGQTIPVIVGAGLILRVFYVFVREPTKDEPAVQPLLPLHSLYQPHSFASPWTPPMQQAYPGPGPGQQPELLYRPPAISPSMQVLTGPVPSGSAPTTAHHATPPWSPPVQELGR
ncbi:hypothetical protein B0T10DRAFT_551461 [Thelonectria olida]|uniref:Uncharacterized protein n=1 Tax=Thelonectria olida TaxID=1576542 RepID=A0A9P9AHR6_9HYPO|nr:hypothetical protein B0T10DRAFT_551461 [Thelonectria olida]